MLGIILPRLDGDELALIRLRLLSGEVVCAAAGSLEWLRWRGADRRPAAHISVSGIASSSADSEGVAPSLVCRLRQEPR